GVSGFDGSHGRSQDAFRTRISRQVRASETRTGRSDTGASSRSGSLRVAGHPWMRPTASIIPLCGNSSSLEATLSGFRYKVRVRAAGMSGTGTRPLVVTAADLVDRVHQDRPQHVHAVPDPAG